MTLSTVKYSCRFLCAYALVLICCCTAYAQPPAKTYVYIIDSVHIKKGLWPYLVPNNVAGVRVVKDDPKYHMDAAYMTLKNHDLFFNRINGKFLTPDAIAKKYIPGYNKKTQVIFIWNDNLLADTAEAGVPERYFVKADVVKASATVYAKTLPKAVFLKIYSKTP